MKNKIYKQFRLGDIFDKLDTKYIGKHKDKKQDVSKERTKEFCVPVVYAKSGDNGIMYWARKNTFTTYSNVLSIIYNGAIATGLVYAQEIPTGILAESYMIRIKKVNISFEVNLYLKTTIQKAIFDKYNRNNLATWHDKVENDIIQLPIKDNIEEKEKYGINDIDYEYMEERIKELEEERIKELEKYLEVSGLENYELTKEDEEVLGRKVEFKEFKVGEIFELVNPKGKLNTKQLIEGKDIPYVGAKKTYNGIVKMCSKENIPEEQIMKGNAMIFVQQGDGSAGYTTYQPNRFYAISCVCCGYWDKLNENIAMYIMPELDKNKMLYSHSQSWNTERIKETRLHLPVDKKGQIDYEYMNDYIQAIKKKSIAGVVKYKDQVIEITKKVVAKTK